MSLLFSCLCLFLYATIHTKAYKKENFVVIGHRGASGYKPENTISAFQTALDLNAKIIELDVYLCKTGELIVIHDQDLYKLTHMHGNVSEMTLNQLKKLTISGESIPTLEEVITFINKKTVIDIELKGNNVAHAVANIILEFLAQGWSSSDFLVSSFDLEQLKTFKSLCPQISIGALFNTPIKLDAIIPITKKLNADFIGINNAIVNKPLIDLAHQHNLKVYVYTINEKKRALFLKHIGVDGIFSDYPNILSKT